MNQRMKPVLETLQAVFLPVPMSPGLRDAYEKLVMLVDGAADSQELLSLNPEEIRAFHGFRIGLHRFAGMEPDMLAKHVLAQWRAAMPGIQKLSIWPPAQDCIKQIDRNHERPPEL